jgi:hypothetical protein
MTPRQVASLSAKSIRGFAGVRADRLSLVPNNIQTTTLLR